MNKLLGAHANPEMALPSNATPLYIASSKGHVQVVEMLVDAQADPNKSPGHGTTPVSIAVQNGHVEAGFFSTQSFTAFCHFLSSIVTIICFAGKSKCDDSMENDAFDVMPHLGGSRATPQG